MTNPKLVEWLFETKAFRVCPEDAPFWYTSGTIGPYYINAHFLLGSEEKASKMLDFINNIKTDKLGCPGELIKRFESVYSENGIYKSLIDEMADFINKNKLCDDVDFISGGERRDWYFSLLLAKLLNKPHITLYKDLTAVLTEKGESYYTDRISPSRVLHVSDMLNEGSSYERAWVPAIDKKGGRIIRSLAVVDRLQGGAEVLHRYNVDSFCMVAIDNDFFEEAQKTGYISKGQYDTLLQYRANPRESMKSFLRDHPGFLENALKSDEKTKERALLCIEKGFYA